MTKKIYFITQAKGGSGKSVLAFMLAEKYKDAVILDLDDATTTSMKQLAYRMPKKVSFLDHESKRIDRGAFNKLFESVVKLNKELFIADLGASVAEQLPKYFSMNGIEMIMDLLRTVDIQLQLVCVVGGGNIFKATMEYLTELVNSTQGKLEIAVALNGFYPCAQEQKDKLLTYINVYKLSLIDFDLVKDKGEMAMRTVDDVLRGGKGTSELNPFAAIYFKKPIADLNL
jgi:Mrp family chromosome partitioning ATPase